MSRHRFEAYLDKVFGFSELVRAMPEGRQCPRHPWHKVFSAVFLGAAMQTPSLLQIEAECRGGALAKRIGPISDDTIGYALQRQPPEAVFDLGCEVASRLKRNGPCWSRTSPCVRHSFSALCQLAIAHPEAPCPNEDADA